MCRHLFLGDENVKKVIASGSFDATTELQEPIKIQLCGLHKDEAGFVFQFRRWQTKRCLSR